jgi:uncharacterized protein
MGNGGESVDVQLTALRAPVLKPYIRFQRHVGEQATMFLFDPCGNALEFKAFKDIGQSLAR